MHKSMKTVVVASLMIVLVIGSPVATAQTQRTNSTDARNMATSTGEGKILWEYNTHG